MKAALTSQEIVDGFLLVKIQHEPLARQLILYRAVAASPHFGHLAEEATKLADKVELLLGSYRKASAAHRFEAITRALAITPGNDV